jgi:murein DD-endopeptidase MepM/ murein hydrolase activator NlpD
VSTSERIFPVAMLEDGRRPEVSNPFRRGTHDGVDIAFRAVATDPPFTGRDTGARTKAYYNPAGQPALAWAPGLVQAVGDIGNGVRVRLLHRPKGAAPFRSYYLHLDRALVHVGAEVKAGDVLGIIGGNPHRDPPGFTHLHFALRGPSGWVDPRPIMTSEGWRVLTHGGDDAGPFGTRAAAARSREGGPEHG